MKYLPIGSELFIENRKRLAYRLKEKSVAIFHSADVMPAGGADGVMPFKQDANIFYLTGIDQEETILLLTPNFPDERYHEVLFLRKTDDETALWEGHKYTKQEATEASGIKTVMWLDEFELVLQMVLAETDHIYLDTNEHIRNASLVETRTDRFITWCQKKYKMHRYERIAPIIYALRCIKAPREVELIQHACDITEVGFRKILRTLRPGVWEYEVEAELVYEFLKRRSSGFAYAPIVAAGASACVLHYVDNNQQCQDGDLVLLDVGAEYANYNADMTRVVPVSGRFSPRQRAVYDAVLRVKNEATALLVPGTTIPEYHKAVGEVMEKELLALGLISKRDIEKQSPNHPAYKKYFMHGTSHHLGLNVHDVASVYEKIVPGMVFTVEPAIYIIEENIGIRLEDDLLITAEGSKNLMKNIPIHAEEIESLMNE